MLQNRGWSRPTQASAEEQLRSNVADLFSSGRNSGSRIQEVFNDIAACGLDSFTQVSAARPDRNAARNLQRRLIRVNTWPSLYEFPIQVLHPTTGEEVLESMVWVRIWHKGGGLVYKTGFVVFLVWTVQS